MRTTRQVTIVALLAALWPVAKTYADPIQISFIRAGIAGSAAVELGRTDEIGFDQFRFDSADLGPSRLSSALMIGTADSSLRWLASPMRFMASGEANATAGPAGLASAEGRFFVRFLVLEPVPFAFSGFQSGFGGNFVNVGLIGVSEGLGAVINHFFTRAPGQSFSHAGTLVPGDYFFSADFSAIAVDPPLASSSRVDVDVTFHPVPEPATMLLLGTGLFGVGALRRRASTNVECQRSS